MMMILIILILIMHFPISIQHFHILIFIFFVNNHILSIIFLILIKYNKEIKKKTFSRRKNY